MKTLIIIPAYNEEDSIEKVVDNLIENYPEYDYLVINDGSCDHTFDVCKKRGYEVIDLSVNLGIGGAVQAGYRYARRGDYDIAVQMDGDGQHDPAYLREMIEIIEKKEADEVIGSRFITKEGFQSTSSRRAGINILSTLGWLLTGVRVRDITSGYRVVNRKLINVFASDYPGDYPEPEAMVISAINGCTIKEYPVIMREREAGKSSINVKKSVYYMLKVSIAMIIRRLSLGFRRTIETDEEGGSEQKVKIRFWGR